MQLRVARLCLDCEELHTDNSCPRCASESYGFLSTWLQVEERRRWRRPAAAPVSAGPWWSETPATLLRSLGRWMAGDPPEARSDGPATRAADRAAQLNFDQEPANKPELETKVPSHHVRKV